jgi:hypothetical protein
MIVSRSGRPSLALLPGGTREPLAEADVRTRRIIDLRNSRPLPAMLELARRPTAEAAVSGSLQRLLVRLLGIRPLSS